MKQGGSELILSASKFEEKVRGKIFVAQKFVRPEISLVYLSVLSAVCGTRKVW